jgi:hypothetical protein
MGRSARRRAPNDEAEAHHFRGTMHTPRILAKVAPLAVQVKEN